MLKEEDIDFNEALSYYKQAAKIDNNNYMFHLKQGKCHEKNRAFAEAIEAYKKSVNLSDREATLPLYKLGWAYVRTKQPQKGVKILKEAILLDPENSEVLTKIGAVLLRDNDELDEAENFLKRALSLNPEQTEAIVNLARIMEKREKNEKAMELYQKALKLPGNHVHTYFYLAVFNEKMESYKNAITYFKKCISLDNGHYMSCMHLATLLVNAGETNRAEKYYKHALKIDPESLDAHFALGKLTHYTFEDPKTALEYYNFVVSKDPGHYKALCQLGILY